MLMALVLPVAAQGFQGWASKDLMKKPLEAEANLPPSPYASKPLPELKGVVSWKTLADVKTVKQKDRFMPEFGKSVATLDKKEVKIQGFMMPLEPGERQRHFLLSSVPMSCSFCVPGGPESMVEVKTRTPVKYSLEPVVVEGKFAVLADDPYGLYYRITDAVAVK